MLISFSLSKLLSLLFYPLSQVLLLLLAALVAALLRWRTVTLVLLVLGGGELYLFSTGAVSTRLMAALERPFPPRSPSALPDADVIVLLGGATRGVFHPAHPADLNAQADRLLHTARLYRAGKAPRVLVSGGVVGGTTAEARLMAEHLEALGVPRQALILEDASRTTRENARFVLPRLRGLDARRVLLVTSAFHMRRAMLLFDVPDLAVLPAATDYQVLSGPSLPGDWWPTAAGLQRSTLALHEMAGYRVYRLRHWWNRGP